MKQQEILERTSIINVKNKLHLKETFSTKDTIFVKCPFCFSDKGTMKLDTTENSYTCKNCGANGYAIGLYARNKYITNRRAYELLLQEDADLSNNLKTSIITSTRKNNEELDIIYQSFLENLDLKPEHIMELLNYGFSIEDIEKIGFKSIPMNEKERISICNKLIQENLDLEGTPGFFKDKRFRWNFKAHKGILVPVKESHRIIGLRIHLENLYDADTSDIWFSSSQECNGSKILNNIMFLYPEGNSIRFMNNKEPKDIIIASEMILAYKVHLYFNNNIVIGVPNVVSKKELKKLDKIQNVNEVHVVLDKHTVLHNSESLLSNLYKLYPRRKVTLHFSLKDGEIPRSIERLNKDYDIQKKSA